MSVAATVYASIYDRSPVSSNSFAAFGEVDRATIEKLQLVAQDKVKRFYGR